MLLINPLFHGLLGITVILILPDHETTTQSAIKWVCRQPTVCSTSEGRPGTCMQTAPFHMLRCVHPSCYKKDKHNSRSALISGKVSQKCSNQKYTCMNKTFHTPWWWGFASCHFCGTCTKCSNHHQSQTSGSSPQICRQSSQAGRHMWAV